MKIKENFFLVFKPERQFVSPRINQVYLELSTHCNLSCRGCARNSIVDFKKSHVTPAMMERILPMLKKACPERIVLLGFGEALCNPHIKNLLASLRRMRAELVLVTNATFLTEEMSSFLVDLPLDRIFVSWDDDIDGSDAELRRGSDAGIFRKNIGNLSRCKSSTENTRPHLGLEMVASRRNYRHLGRTIAFGAEIGIESFIVTNLFPYSEAMANEILYTTEPRPEIDLRRILRGEIKRHDLRVANQTAHGHRLCPFIEKGTAFITARGDVTPCPELAYTHPAYYFGTRRMHNRHVAGNLHRQTLEDLWNGTIFTELRSKFLYYDFPDCSYCYRPDLCYQRTVEDLDCAWNPTPCGECLWAKEIIICP